MKRLIFSDTHLSSKFEPALFDYITHLVDSVDQVIINGDFWDSYLMSFDEFVNSEWRHLFPILLKKNTIYVLGNHDEAESIDERANLFSVEQLGEYRFKAGGKTVIVAHGHKIAPEFDGTFPGITKKFGHFYPHVYNLSRSPSAWGKIYRPIKKRHYLYNMRRLHKFALESLNDSELLICGHSHVQLDDREHGFINIGPTQQGVAHYLIIDGGKFTLEEKNYEKLAENSAEQSAS